MQAKKIKRKVFALFFSCEYKSEKNRGSPDQDDTTWSAWPRVRGTWCQKDDTGKHSFLLSFLVSLGVPTPASN